MKGNSKRLVSAMERELGEAELRHRKQKLEQRLKQLERFEAIRRLAGGIAHDFNNIIGTIMGWAELGYEHASAHPLSQQRFDKIRGEARRADGLTSQLLAFARWQVLQSKPLDPSASHGRRNSCRVCIRTLIAGGRRRIAAPERLCRPAHARR